MSRHADLSHFYDFLSTLESVVGGKRLLADCSGRMDWAKRGVYFFFEEGEIRSDTGDGPRIVRVGTHALRHTSQTTLWNRLSQHQGVRSTGRGNHRGSIFRHLVGTAIMHRNSLSEPQSWGVGNDPGFAARSLGLTRDQVVMSEGLLEAAVSEHIRRMPFLWLAVDDVAGPQSDRSVIERSAIALVSNFEKPALDPPSAGWLGTYCDRQRVRQSGLWNNHHVDEAYGPGFLALMEQYVDRMSRNRK
jgi:hypothetical protein